MKMKAVLSVLTFCAALTLGCTGTEYKPYEESETSSVNLLRTVNFYVNPALKKESPQCVLVLPPQKKESSGFAHRVEKTIVRHLSEKFPRVIGGRERKARAVKLAFDLTALADRREFAQEINCSSVFEFRIFQPRHEYMLIWSEIKIGLEARLFRQSDGTLLWKAQHVAKRSDGGVSFSPFGLAVNAYEANALSSDGDVVESVTEDLVRRVMKSMPVMYAPS
jgi:hypothetical protein